MTTTSKDATSDGMTTARIAHGPSKARSNKATHSRDSIAAHAKNLLIAIRPAVNRVPRNEREEGPVARMVAAAHNIIHDFHIAYNCEECRLTYIQHIFGYYGELKDNFELADRFNLLTDGEEYAIALCLESIEAGVTKWHAATKTKAISTAA